MLPTPVRALALALPLLCYGSTASAQRAETSVLVATPATEHPAPPTPARGGIEYLYDDGAAGSNIGPPSSFDPDMLWGTYYYTQTGGEVITEIAVAFGPTFPSVGNGVTFWLLNDPDADGDPRNATALTSVEATPNVSGNTFFRVTIPPTQVSGAFFVGASALLDGGADRPARVDTDARADRSWFFYAPDIAAVINNLSSAPFSTRMDNTANVPIPGGFMIRAQGESGSTTGTTTAPGAQALGLRAMGPNPVVGTTALRFSLPVAAAVVLDVLDVAGRQVARLAASTYAAGEHTVVWSARGMAPGVYVGRLVAGSEVRTVRLSVVR